MKNFALFFSLFFCVQILSAQTWVGLSAQLNTPPRYATYLGAGKIMFAGDFTGTTSGINSPGFIIFSIYDNTFLPVTGFNPTTDTITGLVHVQDSLIATGHFKVGTSYYAGLFFPGPQFNAPMPYAKLKLTGPSAVNAVLYVAGSNPAGDLLIYGNNMVINSTSFVSAKVGLIESNNTRTAIQALKPLISGNETPYHNNIGWDPQSGLWVCIGNYDHVGPTLAYDAATWNGGSSATAVSTTTDSGKYARGFVPGYIGWNGNGFNSPGGLRLINSSIYPLNTGFNIDPYSMKQVQSNVWVTGKQTGTPNACIATFSVIDSVWTDRQGNLDTTGIVYGMVAVGDTIYAFGTFLQFGGIAKTIVYNPPLPVELDEFNATLLEDGTVLVSWKTATETNNAWYLVEHSTDGVNWITVDSIRGAGTTTIPKNYSYIHQNPEDGFNYYRLRQIDFDGKTTYSPIRIVKTQGEEIKVFPNPANKSVTLSFDSKNEGLVNIVLVNKAGQNVFDQNVEAKKGANLVPLYIDTLPAGTYLVRLYFVYHTKTIQLIKN